MPKKNDSGGIGSSLQILQLNTGQLRVHILGRTPLIYNAMSSKAKHELLMPRGRLSTAEKAQNLKHSPAEEYRASVYSRPEDEKGPTRLIFPAAAFKRAAMNAALAIPGAKKAEIARLLWVEGSYVDIYGVPQLLMSVVRSADMSRTPDVRTRAILANWACVVDMTYVMPALRPNMLGNLMAAAGLVIGVGDYRQEKGAGNFGQFSIVDQDDATFNSVVENGGVAVQDRALAEPSAFDRETEELLIWYSQEFVHREKAVAMKPARRSSNGATPNDQPEA